MSSIPDKKRKEMCRHTHTNAPPHTHIHTEKMMQRDVCISES